MSLLDELQQRGLYASCTDPEGLAKQLATESTTLYAGYDPTSSSLHVGNLVPSILLKRFQLAGHRPIVVVGGATGMVGDPSGKSDERNLLDDATLATNLAGIRAQLSRLLDFDDPKTGALMTNNADWTRGVSYLEFLRDIGKHLTINYMMAKDSVKAASRTRPASATPSSRTCCCRRSTSSSSTSATAADSRSAATTSTATSPRAASCRARWAAASCSA